LKQNISHLYSVPSSSWNSLDVFRTPVETRKLISYYDQRRAPATRRTTRTPPVRRSAAKKAKRRKAVKRTAVVAGGVTVAAVAAGRKRRVTVTSSVRSSRYVRSTRGMGRPYHSHKAITGRRAITR
jgi:hypothetical protein